MHFQYLQLNVLSLVTAKWERVSQIRKNMCVDDKKRRANYGL